MTAPRTAGPAGSGSSRGRTSTSRASGASWLLRAPSPQARARLFCLPYPGCGASMYHRWPRYLGTIEICPVQPPGRENRMREPVPGAVEEFAAGLVEGVTPYLDKPYGFFGHCGGALPAFVASQQMGTGPTHLFVSAQPAPHDGPPSRFLDMDEATLRAELTEITRQLGAEPRPQFIDLGVKTLRADVESHRRYRPSAPSALGCPVTAIGWTQDVEVPETQMRGWADYGAVTHRSIDGDHFDFLDAPRALRETLCTDFSTSAGTDFR